MYEIGDQNETLPDHREHKDAPRHGMPDLEETPSGDMAIAPSGNMPVEGEGSLRESPMTYSPGALRRPKATSESRWVIHYRVKMSGVLKSAWQACALGPLIRTREWLQLNAH